MMAASIFKVNDSMSSIPPQFDDSRSKDLHSLSCSADSTGSEKDGSTIQLLVDTVNTFDRHLVL